MIEKDKLILLNDDDLMENICRGNDDAFTELFNRYKSGVVNFVYRQCGDYGKSEDIAQECFLRVYNNARSYKANGKFKNWILTIAVNVTRSILVKKAKNIYLLIQILKLQTKILN
jgi:RNA polymerase sigma-70 factor (ECF subfamily)